MLKIFINNVRLVGENALVIVLIKKDCDVKLALKQKQLIEDQKRIQTMLQQVKKVQDIQNSEIVIQNANSVPLLNIMYWAKELILKIDNQLKLCFHYKIKVVVIQIWLQLLMQLLQQQKLLLKQQLKDFIFQQSIRQVDMIIFQHSNFLKDLLIYTLLNQNLEISESELNQLKYQDIQPLIKRLYEKCIDKLETYKQKIIWHQEDQLQGIRFSQMIKLLAKKWYNSQVPYPKTLTQQLMVNTNHLTKLKKRN